MARKAASASMNHTERLAGTIFFVVYLLVMPLLAQRLFSLFELLLDTQIGAEKQNALYYYLLFAVTLIIFHRYIGHTTSRLLDNLDRAAVTLFLGLLIFYGANELLYRVFHVFFHIRANLNDVTIAAQVNAAPRTTALIVIFLAPFVEETLFRGLVFGCLREKSAVVGYAVSALLFAFLHVWTFALSSWDASYFALMLQYLAPGLVFAWAYDRSGTLWTSILLHAIVNALALYVSFV